MCGDFLFKVMARQDIHIDAIHGEVYTTDNLTNKNILPFTLFERIEGLDNDRYCYGEISAPVNFVNMLQNEVRFKAEYKPYYKELFIRFAMNNSNGSVEYMINRTDNKIWFRVYRTSEDEQIQPIRYTELFQINETGHFNLILKDGGLCVYSGNETDFQIKAALKQNEIFLLKAFPGNLYQFPSTGVGLIDFLHGNFENTGLAAKLKAEFDNDQMTINDAYMDTATGELLLSVTEKKENG